MYIKKETINVDEMTLYDYVMKIFESHFDLTDGRFKALNYYLDNCYAKYVNMGEFKSVFLDSDEGFFAIIRIITDNNRLEDLNKYGLMCYQAKMEADNLVLDNNRNLSKMA